jgi:L-histidine Nalpha-methyltransferase
MATNYRKDGDPWNNLPLDIQRGLTSNPKFIPSKYFYDRKGSLLFDKICSLPEYYQTRAEKTLLEEYSPEIVRLTQARELFELGSGVALKTVVLIKSFLNHIKPLTYIPMDISPSALEEAKRRLHSYSGLTIQPLIGDYTRNLACISPNETCLVLFLGSTIGNLNPEQTQAMLSSISSRLNQGDWLLLGLDLMKDAGVIETAYNDTQGLTSAFNKNILNVINRHLDGNFNLNDFSHLAFLNIEKSQVEMHLTANKKVFAHLKKINLHVEIQKGESILTEISRKFRRKSTAVMMKKSGFKLRSWMGSDNGYFALALAEVE